MASIIRGADIGRLLSTPSTTATDGLLRAELWADVMSKIISCWIPVALATVVVGGNLFGSSLQCFPLHLTSSLAENVSNASLMSADAYREPSLYTRQLAEFVNVYCGGQTSFSYRIFVMMLVGQSVVMYAPHLIWNITTGRKITCNLKFIRHDLEVLYHRFRARDASTSYKYMYGQEELTKVIKGWFKSREIYYRYITKQTSSAMLAVISIVLFSIVEPVSVRSIQDSFKCAVQREFEVECSVYAASLYRIAWWTNMCLLGIAVLMFFVHMFYLHCRLHDRPFEDIGLRVPDRQTLSLNDCHLMYAFLKANLDSIEKFNYATVLYKILPEKRKRRAKSHEQETSLLEHESNV